MRQRIWCGPMLDYVFWKSRLAGEKQIKIIIQARLLRITLERVARQLNVTRPVRLLTVVQGSNEQVYGQCARALR